MIYPKRTSPGNAHKEHVNKGRWQVTQTGVVVFCDLNVDTLGFQGMILVLHFGQTITLNIILTDDLYPGI